MDNGILYMPEPDYDMSDDSALLPLASRNTVALRGVDNPIFIPDPDYPLYAGYESFDEINGSLVWSSICDINVERDWHLLNEKFTVMNIKT